MHMYVFMFVCVCECARDPTYPRFNPGGSPPGLRHRRETISHWRTQPYSLPPEKNESKRKNKEQYRKVNISCICVFCCRETLKDVCMRPGSLISPPVPATSSSVGLQLGGTMRDGRTLRSSALANNGTGDDREEK